MVRQGIVDSKEAVSLTLIGVAWLFLGLRLSGRVAAVSARLRVRSTHAWIVRGLSHLMAHMSRTLSGCFAGVHFGLVSRNGSLLPMFFRISCSRNVMFRYVTGLVFSFSRSRRNSGPLCAAAMLRALVE